MGSGDKVIASVAAWAGALVLQADCCPEAFGQIAKPSIPSAVGAVASPPSVHLACHWEKMNSGWFGARYAILVKNTTGHLIPANAIIKWKVREIVNSPDNAFKMTPQGVTGSGGSHSENVQTGEFVIRSRGGLAVGAQVKVGETQTAATKTVSSQIAGCDATI